MRNNKEPTQTDEAAAATRGTGARLFECGRIFTRVAWIAGAMPNAIPVASATKMVKARIRQSMAARKVISSLPPDSNQSRKRIPAAATPSPRTPPGSESSKLSVSNCRSIRIRLAPRLRRTAISRRRAAERDSSRFAMLAQAIARISATMVMRTHNGL